MIKHIKRTEIPGYLQQLQPLFQLVNQNDQQNTFAKAVVKNYKTLVGLSNSNETGMKAYQKFQNEFNLISKDLVNEQGQPKDVKVYNDKFNEIISLPDNKLAKEFYEETFEFNIVTVFEHKFPTMSAAQLMSVEFMTEDNKSKIRLT